MKGKADSGVLAPEYSNWSQLTPQVETEVKIYNEDQYDVEKTPIKSRRAISISFLVQPIEVSDLIQPKHASSSFQSAKPKCRAPPYPRSKSTAVVLSSKRSQIFVFLKGGRSQADRSMSRGSGSSRQQYQQPQGDKSSTWLSAVRQAGQAASTSSEEMKTYRLDRGFETWAGFLPGTSGASNRGEDARRAIREFEKRFGKNSSHVKDGSEDKKMLF